MASRPTDADPSDPWPRRALADDALDHTSDDTFTEEATIPVKPRPGPSGVLSEVEWPPRAPSIPKEDETAEPAQPTPASASPARRARPLEGAASGVDRLGGDGDNPAASDDVLTLDRPPVITRPWLPVRHRALDPDALVRRRRSWTTWLPIVVVVVGTALVVALAGG